jgi:hemolysin III
MWPSPREAFNSISHQLGAIFSLFITALYLIYADDNVALKCSLVVYGLSTFGMFLASALYHGINGSKETIAKLRKLDHIMIYIVIAGGYTPIAVDVLQEPTGLYVLISIWLFAGIGVLKKLFWMHAPSWLSTLIYLVMGWVSVFILPSIWANTSPTFVKGIIVGGLFYTVGAFVYGLKKPNIWPERVGFHGLWHIFVLAGAVSHLLAHLFYFTSLG